MKLAFIILSITSLIYSQLAIGCTSCIGTVNFPVRPIYISKHISQDHVESIHWAMSEYNRYATLWNDELFTETDDKNENHIRIEYASYNGCSMSSVSMSEGFFQVSETIIGFQQSLDSVMTQCIVLHELGHALGLGHTSNETDSIMHEILFPRQEMCTLKKTDIINIANGYQ